MNLQEQMRNYLEYCLYRKELDLKTIKAYRIDIRQFIEMAGEGYPDRGLIEEYITHLHKQFKKKTVKRKIASMKAFLTYLEELDILENGNPFNKIRVKFKEDMVLPRIIPRNDIEKLLNYMHYENNKSDKNNNLIIRDLAIVELLFATGARVYEISNLKKECIDLSMGVIRFMGKGKKERYIQIGDEKVLALLNEYFKVNKDDILESGYFFVNNRGKRYTEQSIRNMINKYTAKIHLETHITPHMFRHSLATYLIEEGVDITYVQKILGHSSIKTTQIYIYVASKKQAEILRDMHPRNKMKIDGVA